MSFAIHRRRSGVVGRVVGRSVVCLGLTLGVVVATAGVAGAAKVNIASPSFGLTEGGSRVVQVTLEQPIINPGVDPGFVTMTLAPADPTRISLSTASLTWQANEWFQARTVTVTAVADGVHNATDTVVVNGVVTTNAPFYAGVTAAMTVTIADLDPAPTTTTAAATTTTTASPTTSAPPTTSVSSTTAAIVPTTNTPAPRRRVAAADAARGDELAATGVTTELLLLAGVASVALGALFLVASRRQQRG